MEIDSKYFSYIVIPGFQLRWYNIQYKTYAYQFMELGLAHGKLANVLHGLDHCYEVTQCNISCTNNKYEIVSTFTTETVISFSIVKKVKYELQHLVSWHADLKQ